MLKRIKERVLKVTIEEIWIGLMVFAVAASPAIGQLIAKAEEGVVYQAARDDMADIEFIRVGQSTGEQASSPDSPGVEVK